MLPKVSHHLLSDWGRIMTQNTRIIDACTWWVISRDQRSWVHPDLIFASVTFADCLEEESRDLNLWQTVFRRRKTHKNLQEFIQFHSFIVIKKYVTSSVQDLTTVTLFRLGGVYILPHFMLFLHCSETVCSTFRYFRYPKETGWQQLKTTHTRLCICALRKIMLIF